MLLSRPSDSMTRNKKQMKHEATPFTKAQRCEIIAKSSKPNASSQRAKFNDANNKEHCVVVLKDVNTKQCELKENHLLMTKSNILRQLLNLKVPPTSNALKPYTTLSSTSMTTCFAPRFKQKLDNCMMNCNDRSRLFNDILTN